MFKAAIVDFHTGAFIAVASYEEQELWKKLKTTGKTFMVQNRHGYPHQVIVQENAEGHASEKRLTLSPQKKQ